MTERLTISVDPGLIRAVRAVDGRADACRWQRRDRPGVVGDIYLGRVTRVLPGFDAAFVDCGLERDGFLSGASRHRCREGQAATVQAVSDPAPGKGARLSASLRFAGRFAVYRPDRPGVSVSRRIADGALRERLAAAAAAALRSRPGGAVVRTAAAGAGADALAADIARLAAAADETARAAAGAAPPRRLRPGPGAVERLLRDFAAADTEAVILDDADAARRARRYAERFAPDLAGRIVRHAGPRPLFVAEGVAEDVDGLSEPRTPLANGGALTIERTEGMWAIDVDSAGFSGLAAGNGALRLNLAAAVETARQLRLRDISGLVVVDFAGMAGRRDGESVVGALRRAVARDHETVRVAPMSPFGAVELSRRRAGAGVADLLTEACASCGGGGRRKTAFAVACEIVRACLAEAAERPGRRLAVRAAPEALAALAGPLRAAVDAACAAVWRAEAGWARERFEVSAEGGP